MAKTSFPITDGAGTSQDMEAYASGASELASAVVLESSDNAAIADANPLPVTDGLMPRTVTYTNQDVAAISGSVLATNANRLFVQFINASDTAIYLKAGGSAVVGQGIYLAANGGSWSIGQGWETAAFYAIHGGSGSKRLLIIEVD